jgi:1-acyl-sn-glycerol-3-phosphate acyltransferase
VAERSAAFYAFGRFVIKIVAGLAFRLRVYGRSNLPAGGGGLLVANHQSFLDPPLVGAAATRPLVFMARRGLFTNALFGGMIRRLGAIPVRPGRPDKGAMRQAIEKLRQGELVLIFPEGTRTFDGEVGTVRPGFRLLVERAGVPLIPVGLDGAYRAWPRSKKLPRPGRIRVAFGRPIPPEELSAVPEKEVADRVRGELCSLVEALRRLP